MQIQVQIQLHAMQMLLSCLLFFRNSCLLLVDMQSQVFNALGSALDTRSSLEFSPLIILSAHLALLGLWRDQRQYLLAQLHAEAGPSLAASRS